MLVTPKDVGIDFHLKGFWMIAFLYFRNGNADHIVIAPGIYANILTRFSQKITSGS